MSSVVPMRRLNIFWRSASPSGVPERISAGSKLIHGPARW
jgi:hypothetical protein